MQYVGRILVIDDDRMLRQFLCKVLKNQENIEVFEAANGVEGLDFLHSEKVNLVVTDIFMPGEDGIGTIMEICDNYPDVKIIAMSGGGNVEDVDFLQLAFFLGAHRVLQKPFDTAVFLSTVQELLQ